MIMTVFRNPFFYIASLCVLFVIVGFKKEPRVYQIVPGPDAQKVAIEALYDVQSGETIEFEEGIFDFDRSLTMLGKENVTIRGKGRSRTILNFKGQKPGAGAEGIKIIGTNITIADLTVQDAPGDGLKIERTAGLTLRNVGAVWTGLPDSSNGAYGLYPVQCSNVLIDSCYARGASDAGIYVGQSRYVIVRNCLAELNVAGIEIENTLYAEVHDCIAQKNTGGILVFDLPNLPQKNGHHVRVYNNTVTNNNTPNFAPIGTTVGQVPPGTGILVMATKHVEIFNNTISGNNVIGTGIISYSVLGQLNPGFKYNDSSYNPFTGAVSVYNNRYISQKQIPDVSSDFGKALRRFFDDDCPDIIYDGFSDSLSDQPDENKFCFRNNGHADFGNLNAKRKFTISRDLAPFDCSLNTLPPVTLISSPSAPGQGVAEPPHIKLSDYHLFQGNLGDIKPAEGVVPYDLNSALFSDYSEKARFVYVPPGKKATYNNNGVIKFPDETILIKNFYYWKDARNKAIGRRILETRLLIRKNGVWQAHNYLWNEAQTDAFYTKAGGEVPVHWIDNNGLNRFVNYRIPSLNDCKGCHQHESEVVDSKKAVSRVIVTDPIGPKARNLNKLFTYADGTSNQLKKWAAVGILEGVPDLASIPVMPRWDNPESGTLEARARAYLDVNCGHCHNANGPAGSTGHLLTYETPYSRALGILKIPIAAGRGSGNLRYDILPSKADSSILIYRIQSLEPEVMMPEMGRTLIHVEGVSLLKDWINSLSIENSNH